MNNEKIFMRISIAKIVGELQISVGTLLPGGIACLAATNLFTLP